VCGHRGRRGRCVDAHPRGAGRARRDFAFLSVLVRIAGAGERRS
jgi:hypothetical protein